MYSIAYLSEVDLNVCVEIHSKENSLSLEISATFFRISSLISNLQKSM